MQIYPAIDIRNGECIRLRQGQFHDASVYSQTPIKVAKLWEQQGATYIHIVDLDGARSGISTNENAIREIAESVSIPIQVGGGIRTKADIEKKFSLGVQRVIIGTKAVENPDFIKEIIQIFGADRIVAGIDAKEGKVATDGWEKVSELDAVELAIHMKELGIQTIVYTDIAKDGMLSGPNVERTKEIVDVTGLDVIASGGVSSIQDLDAINQIHVEGTIIGKALYEKRLDLRKIIKQYERG